MTSNTGLWGIGGDWGRPGRGKEHHDNTVKRLIEAARGLYEDERGYEPGLFDRVMGQVLASPPEGLREAINEFADQTRPPRKWTSQTTEVQNRATSVLDAVFRPRWTTTIEAQLATEGGGTVAERIVPVAETEKYTPRGVQEGSDLGKTKDQLDLESDEALQEAFLEAIKYRADEAYPAWPLHLRELLKKDVLNSLGGSTGYQGWVDYQLPPAQRGKGEYPAKVTAAVNAALHDSAARMMANPSLAPQFADMVDSGMTAAERTAVQGYANDMKAYADSVGGFGKFSVEEYILQHTPLSLMSPSAIFLKGMHGHGVADEKTGASADATSFSALDQARTSLLEMQTRELADKLARGGATQQEIDEFDQSILEFEEDLLLRREQLFEERRQVSEMIRSREGQEVLAAQAQLSQIAPSLIPWGDVGTPMFGHEAGGPAEALAAFLGTEFQPRMQQARPFTALSRLARGAGVEGQVSPEAFAAWLQSRAENRPEPVEREQVAAAAAAAAAGTPAGTPAVTPAVTSAVTPAMKKAREAVAKTFDVLPGEDPKEGSALDRITTTGKNRAEIAAQMTRRADPGDTTLRVERPELAVPEPFLTLTVPEGTELSPDEALAKAKAAEALRRRRTELAKRAEAGL
jgi:hypothetical protein